MTLRINILGFEVAKVDLDMGEQTPAAPTVAEKAIHTTTKWWLGRLFK